MKKFIYIFIVINTVLLIQSTVIAKSWSARIFPNDFENVNEIEINKMSGEEFHDFLFEKDINNYKIRKNDDKLIQNSFSHLKNYNYIQFYEFCTWDSFQAFLDNPCKEKLDEKFKEYNNVDVINYYWNTGVAPIIYKVFMNDPQYYVFYGPSSVAEYSSGFLDRDTLQKYTIENLQIAMDKVGINEKVEDRYFIANDYYPLILMIKTNNTYYYIRDLANDDFEYNFYKLEDLKNSFECKKGDLIIENNIYKDAVLVINRNYLVKGRCIIEALTNKKVIWNDEDKSISYYLGNDLINYSFKTDINEPYKINGDGLTEFYEKGGNLKIFDDAKFAINHTWTAPMVLIDDISYFDYRVGNFLKGFNKKAKFDYKNNILEIYNYI